MATDADKINGLVSLLKAVGIDDGSGNPAGKKLDEAQIQNIIRKLQGAQAEAPQIIAALEAHAKNKKAPSRQPQPPPPPEDGDYELDEEEDDDEANYPMVGPGCSDDISVVSDLTTPTVVSSLHVPEEEQYKETTPPMIVGSMLVAPTKRKNLVNAPRGMPRKTAASGGAAAQRRKHYNATMEKLGDKKSSSHGRQPQATPKQKPPGKASRRNSAGARPSEWGSQWNAFDAVPSKTKGNGATLIDDDGFLMNNDAGFSDAFNPFQEDPFAKTVKKVPKKSKDKSMNKSKGSIGSSDKGSSSKRRPRRASLAM